MHAQLWLAYLFNFIILRSIAIVCDCDSFLLIATVFHFVTTLQWSCLYVSLAQTMLLLTFWRMSFGAHMYTFPPDRHLGVALAGCRLLYSSNFHRYCRQFSKVNLTSCTCTSSLAPHSCQYLILSIFSICTILGDTEWHQCGAVD